MKKLTTLLLAFVLCLGLLAGCGGNTPETTGAATETTEAPTAAPTEQTTEPDIEPILPDLPPLHADAPGELLYRYTVSLKGQENAKALQCNATTSSLAVAKVNNQDEVVLFTYKTVALNTKDVPKGVNIPLAEAPDIDTAKYGSVQLVFDYAYCQGKSHDMNIMCTDGLEVQVSTDGGKTWKEKTAGLLGYQFLGGIQVKNQDFNGGYYRLYTEDLKALVDAGEVITDIILRPTGRHECQYESIRVSEFSLYGYPGTLPEIDAPKVTSQQYDPKVLRNFVGEHLKKLTGYAWTCDEDVVTANYNGSSVDGQKFDVIYPTGIQYYGPIYSRDTIYPLETLLEEVDANGKKKEVSTKGMDCTGFMYDCISRISPNNGWLAYEGVMEDKYLVPVAPLTNDLYYWNTGTILGQFDEQTVFEAYGNTRTGDMIFSFPKATHVRMIAKKALVVRNNDGTINPDKSFVYFTDMAGSGQYTIQKGSETKTVALADGRKLSSSYAGWKVLQGACCRVDNALSFRQALASEYAPYTLTVYETGMVDDELLQAVTPSTPTNVVENGFYVGLTSNYRMIYVEGQILDESGKVLFSHRDYGYHQLGWGWSNKDLDAALKELPAGKYCVKCFVMAGPQTDVKVPVQVTEAASVEFTVR